MPAETAGRHRALAFAAAFATAAILTACSGGDRGALTVPSASSSVEEPPSSPSPSEAPTPTVKENECVVELTGNRFSIDGDSPQLMSSGAGLAISCAGGPYMQIGEDGKTTLVLDCEGDSVRLTPGDDGRVGPYEVELVKDKGSETVVLNVVLT